jgi:hypothetical protein
MQVFPTIISVPIVATMYSNNELGSHCYNSVPTMTSIPTVALQCIPTMTSFPIVPTMFSNDTLGHAVA